MEKASVCSFLLTFRLMTDQFDVLSSGFCFLRRVMTVFTSEVSEIRTSTLGRLGRSLDSPTVNSAPSHSSTSPLIVRINQTLEDTFAQVIQNTPCANSDHKNCGGFSPKWCASTAVKGFPWIISIWIWSSFTLGWCLWMITILIQTTTSLYVSGCVWVFLMILGYCLLWEGVLESEWGLSQHAVIRHSLSLRWMGFPWSFLNRPSDLPQLSSYSECFPLRSRVCLVLHSNRWDACSQTLLIWRS